MEHTHIIKMAGIAEAILFACGESVSSQRLAEVLGTDEKEIPDIIRTLNERYEETGSALHIVPLAKSWQLCTKKEFAPYIRAAMENKKGAPLSNAALEVLTIVAYNQPVTKSFVENVRGVDSSSTVNSLVEKGLLAEAGRLDLPGRPIAYKTTHNFLRCFSLSSLSDLPEIPRKSEQINLDENDYLLIGTPDSYLSMRNFFGKEIVIPLLIELDDGVRLQRALDREKQQQEPKYDEMCRRFLADAKDFSEEKLAKCELSVRFQNDELKTCIASIVEYIEKLSK